MDVNWSLDDIIRQNRASAGRGRGRGRGSGTRGGRGRGGFSRGGRVQGNGFSKGFDNGARSGFVAGGMGGPCRVNIANLHRVSVDDLEELFANYPHDGITLHYDEDGNPLGTADVHFKSRPSFAAKMIRDCDGMRIDGRPLKFYLLGPRPTTAFMHKIYRPTGSFESRFNKVGRKFDNRTATLRGKVAKRGARFERPKITEDELNAQLDAYMGKK